MRKPAQFYDVTIRDVEREDAEQEAKQDGSRVGQGNALEDDVKEESDASEEGTIEVNGKMMTIQEMGQMKVELHQTLGYVICESDISELTLYIDFLG